jgi:SAM-dependent MidA family methyltransferase
MTDSDPLLNIDPLAQAHSDRLFAVIQQHIVDAGGKITFAEYMQLCLYAPGLGYYSAGNQKFGEHGDFTTAPEISPLFSQTLARHIQDVRQQLTEFNVLEFGAGSGKMAGDILLQLDKDDALPDHYYIIEASADLQYRQRQYLAKSTPKLFEKVIWLEQLPEQFIGVIFANEVCDAMPVHRLHFDQTTWHECYVTIDNGVLQWIDGLVSNEELRQRVDLITRDDSQTDYFAEVNLAAEGWVASLADCLKQGAIFIIDYGHDRASYYHPERRQGTMMCYVQHRGHDNPLILPGLQDITSHVEFTALAEMAQASGLDVEGFQTQADFLLAGGITELLEELSSDNLTIDSLQQTTAIKRLTLPSEMGESFKALTLTKDLPELLPRLRLADRRYSL